MQYQDRLVEAYLALVELVRSRVITQPTRLAAENLKTQLETELAHETVSGEQSDASVIPIESKALNKKVAG